MQTGHSARLHLAIVAVLCLTAGPQSGFGQSDAFKDYGSAAWTFGGHAKYQYIQTRIPENSVLQDISGNALQNHNLEMRFKVSARRDHWDVNTHFQFIGVHSDFLQAYPDPHLPVLPAAGVINDGRRWFDLTRELHNEGRNATVLRLDRASVAYTGNKTVLRFGRQAISWGNGLMFTPMDIMNPFDPTAVDKEYKTGDDMLYGQYLLDNGNDIQAIGVVRRNTISGDVEKDESSLAIKYHGFWGGVEYDLLAAEHYSENVLGLGLSTDLVGAVWRGDLVWSDTDTGSVFSTVVGASYSWVSAGHNWTGFLEYYFNGFGRSGGDYSATGLAANPDLQKRLARGELYHLGHHYLGVSATMEVTPLLNLTPNIFINISDPSALAQVVLSYDWRQDFQILAALNVPIGPSGSEYGGIEAGQPGQYVSTGPALFAQLAWYF